ncbi:MAG: hypothetical protein ACRD6W_05950 [Nitrososphaerales archaeon]
MYRQNPLRAECVPVCLSMVIDYMNAHMLRVPTSTLSISDISSKVKTDNVGTEIEDCNLLNDKLEITQAEPSLEFNGSQEPRDIEDIVSDFDDGLPCIAWIGVGKPPFMWKHAVVIRGISLPLERVM